MRRPTRRELLYALAGTAAGGMLAAGIMRRLPAHPDQVQAALAQRRTRELASQVAARAELMSGKWKTFFHPAFSPSIGPRDASRVLVEFTDYTCEPCKPAAEAARQLLRARSDVRLSLMLLPTGGATSEYAARCSFAAYMQHPVQFASLHREMMVAGAALDQDRILGLAAASGLDTKQLEGDVLNPAVRRYLADVRALATDLGISGVPAFALSGHLLLGGASPAQLRALVDDSSAAERVEVADTFTLVARNQRVVSSEELRGRWLLVFFGFTNCPGPCPTAVMDVKGAFERLGAKARDLQFVFITSDPERDTPEILGNYLAKFDERFIGLTGSRAEIEAAESVFGAFAGVEHSTTLYLIDPEGQLARQFSSGFGPERLASSLETLMEQ